MSKQHCRMSVLTLLPFLATMSNKISSFRQSQNKLNIFNLFQLWQKDEFSRKTRSTLLPKQQQCQSSLVEHSSSFSSVFHGIFIYSLPLEISMIYANCFCHKLWFVRSIYTYIAKWHTYLFNLLGYFTRYTVWEECFSRTHCKHYNANVSFCRYLCTHNRCHHHTLAVCFL